MHSMIKNNDVKYLNPRKMNILKKKDQAECIGYILADLKRPYNRLNTAPLDEINFPLTSKLRKAKIKDKPPLAPLPRGAEGDTKYKELKDRVRAVVVNPRFVD